MAAPNLEALAPLLEGSLHTDKLSKILYATDASVYREVPLGVAYPKHAGDLQTIVQFCAEHKIPIIPRAAGTSLAGQCVGAGLVLDVSRYMNKLLHWNPNTGVAVVEPGVIRDELNALVHRDGWWFAPNTSTSNRCMLGGMVGNNSSGTTSIQYGVTRDKVLAIETILADGTLHTFGKHETFNSGAAHHIETALYELLNDTIFRNHLAAQMPKKSIHRRNTGYALDVLAQSAAFEPDGQPWNTAQLLCGSEGTLAISAAITIQLDRLPPPAMKLVALHFHSISECMQAAVLAMQHQLFACELMDKVILDCTKENREHLENRFFVEGDPAALLVVELRAATAPEVTQQAQNLIAAMHVAGFGYAFPIIDAADAPRVWQLRAAGLGLLANIPGPQKALACIEDTAVALEDLPNYISDFEALMQKFGQQAVYYAHAGAGEIHLRPILDLRNPAELAQFEAISAASAQLVKKYQGSLSGEHGDGRVRAPYIPELVGPEVYAAFQKIKAIFDPANILNPGKIVNAAPITQNLREDPQHPLVPLKTIFDYGHPTGFHAATERCNGSGDCRKLEGNGTMCPSYQATRNEQHTTRARANALREFIRESANGQKAFAHPELKEVLDLCVSCKGCARECPSNVDMSGMKAEWLYQYHKTERRRIRDYLLGHFDVLSPWAAALAPLANLPNKLPWLGKPLKKIMGLATARPLPEFQFTTLVQWFNRQPAQPQHAHPKGAVYLFFDEFTNFQEPEIGIAVVQLLWHLGFEVRFLPHAPSGRSQISKGFLETAQKYANRNVEIFSAVIDEKIPLLGIEPSTILSFRDEYPRLVAKQLQKQAAALAKHAFLVEEFLFNALRNGVLTKADFPQKNGAVLLHGHCHQKALGSLRPTKVVLQALGFDVTIVPSGCCGMAGSFGYEAEHYDVSMKMGELVLFPAVRAATNTTHIVAPGTSCRHQIADGTGKTAVHWASLALA